MDKKNRLTRTLRKLVILFLFISLAAGSVFGALTDGVAFHISFDENTGNSTHSFDLVGNRINATDKTPNFIKNNESHGILGQSWYRDTSDGYVEMPSHTAWQQPEVTIKMWYKRTINGGAAGRLFTRQRGAGAEDAQSCQWYDGGQLTCEPGTITPGDPLNNHQWYFIVWQINGTYRKVSINGDINYSSGPGQTWDSGDDELKLMNRNQNDRYIRGNIDELTVWNRTLTEAEILEVYTAELLGNGYNVSWQPPAPPPGGDTLNITSTFPASGSQFNTTNISFNASINHSTEPYNCTLFIGEVANTTWTDQTGPSVNVTHILIGNEYNYSFFCADNTSNETSPTYIFYVDITFPSIKTDFINESIYFKQNLTAQFNFTDDFYLNSYNISIDGESIASSGSLTGTSFNVSISFNVSNLSAGLHYLSVRLADGHTDEKIEDYKVKTGLFGNKLEFNWDDGTKTKGVIIKQLDGSIFDTFSAEKEVDRYTWEFIPFDKKKLFYEFEVETDDPIRIIEDDSTYLGSWITFGDKWVDFNIEGEDEVIKITRLGNNRVKVKISNIKDPGSQTYHSIGDLNILEANYSFYKLNASVSYQSTIFEGSFSPHFLYLSTDDIVFLNYSAYLFWHNETKSNIQTNLSNDTILFNSTVLVTPIGGSPSANWTWFFNVSGYDFNISGSSLFVNMNISNCSGADYVVLNFTIYDEETFLMPSGLNATIETYLTLTPPGLSTLSYEFSVKQLDSNLLICLPNQTLANNSYILYALTKYYYDDHVEEFHYIENFALSKDVIPKVISLFDLKTADSTSFIITYQNEGYLYVEGVVIDLLRQYISNDGEFVSIEHAKTDEGGQTRLHFVTEDVIYKAHVWYNGVLQYTTQDFQALCQATPCQINLRKPYNESGGVSEFDNIVYDITTQDDFYTSKVITFDFSTNDGTSTEITMNVTMTNSVFNDTICSDTKVLSAGSVVCTIPLTYYNSSYTARVYKDGEFIGWRTYTSELDADDVFGRTGVFLAVIGYLLLAFMGISSATASIVLGLVGIILMGMMNIFVGGSAFGIGSSIIWIIIAGAILIYKYQQRRVQ